MKYQLHKKYGIYIGIDTGVETGFAQWHKAIKELTAVCSLKIHVAMDLVRDVHRLNHGLVLVRVEDARKRKIIPREATERWERGRREGAGSVKRDASIWEDFLEDLGVDYEMVPPKQNKTKLSAPVFKRLTGWPGVTNEHGRDAAMLVFGL